MMVIFSIRCIYFFYRFIYYDVILKLKYLKNRPVKYYIPKKHDFFFYQFLIKVILKKIRVIIFKRITNKNFFHEI